MEKFDVATFLADSAHYQTIPIVRRFFADALNPLQIYENLKEEAVFLLESKDEVSPWSRYSFIGLSPFMTIENVNGERFIVIDEHGKRMAEMESLKEAFLYAQRELNVKTVKSHIPFTGGAVGFLSYDFISSLENIQPHQNDDLLMKKAYFTFCKSIVAFDHETREIAVIHYVCLKCGESERTKIQKYEKAIARINELMKKAVKGGVQPVLPVIDSEHQNEAFFADVLSTYTREEFIRDVEKIKKYIAAGDIFQAVLSQRFAKPVSVSGFQLYRMLRKINPSPYMFYISTDDYEIIGSSPEKLIQVQNRCLEIHPIAGTRRRGRNVEEDERLANELLNDTKEQAEHYMLVDLARNDIGRVAKYGSVKTPVLMEIGKFSHVMHLISKVTGELREDVHSIDALLAAFPAGTVSGAPKIRAMQILRELEPTARNLYAGAIAYIGFDGNIDSCIAIRTMVVKSGLAYVQAGAGIVADSLPELEWKETRNKASALMKAIQLAEETFGNKEGAYV